jgi:hypothetical protein
MTKQKKTLTRAESMDDETRALAVSTECSCPSRRLNCSQSAPKATAGRAFVRLEPE